MEEKPEEADGTLSEHIVEQAEPMGQTRSMAFLNVKPTLSWPTSSCSAFHPRSIRSEAWAPSAKHSTVLKQETALAH